MIALQEYLNKSGHQTKRHFVYERRLHEFVSRYPNKKVYYSDDIDNFCNGSQTVKKEMKVIEKYLRLNFKLLDSKAYIQNGNTPKKIGVREAVISFLRDIKRKNYLPSTIKTYESQLKVFITYLDTIQIIGIEEIDKNVIDLYKDYLFRTKHKREKNYEVRSQKVRLQRVKQLFDYLVREEYIFINPCIHLKLPREEKKISRNIFTHNEIEDFFSVIDTTSAVGFCNRAMFETLYATGMRANELCNLKIKHVNFEDRLVTIFDGKGRKDRVCILTEIAKRYIELYIQQVRMMYLDKGAWTKYLFPSFHGKKQDPREISNRMKRYLILADIKAKLSPHAFRRSFATHLLKEGVEIRYIQELLGHKDINSTMRYIHLAISDLRDVLVKFHPRENQLANKKIKFKRK